MSEHLTALCEKYPAVRALLEEYGGEPLRVYLEQAVHEPLPSILPAEELLEEVRHTVEPVFGEEMAKETAALIERQRCISTANHHHMAFDWRMVQSVLLYEEWLRLRGEQRGVVPIFATANVSLKSTVYSRGVIVYDCNLPEKMLRIPVFPRWKSCVMGLEGIDCQRIEGFRKWLLKEKRAAAISDGMFDTLSDFCEEVLENKRVLQYGDFRRQTMVINDLLSQRYHFGRKVRHIWMDMETIAAGLLLKDIQRENAIPYQILFCQKLRERILEKLDGVSGCWTTPGGGTHFFWGLDKRAVRFPLRLQEESGQWALTGKNSAGETVRFPLEADSLKESLKAGKLFPSLFIVFLELYFLRDYTVMGGHFQPAYLRAMRKGMVEAFEELCLFSEETEILRQKESLTILGMAYLMRDRGNGQYFVSTAELWEEPITREEMRNGLETSLSEAYEQSNL